MKAWIRDIAIAVLIAFLVLQFVKPTIVKESSMQPTLYENNYIFLSKQAYGLFGEPEHGDIVVFHTDMKTETGKEKLLIKRIIGLPGDVIDLQNGKVYLNGEELSEDYILESETLPHDNGEHFEVPEGVVFAMGDNRRVSIDSRYKDVGFIPIDEIVGKAFVRLYPFNEIGLL